MASTSGVNGYEVFRGRIWEGAVGPMDDWLWTDSSQHLWTIDLPADLPAGIHSLTVTATDHHGRTYSDTIAFEVVEEEPDMTWQEAFWE